MKSREREFLHDISSPLAGIELLMDLMSSDLPPGMEEKAACILRGVRKMKELVRERQKELADERKR